MRKRALMALLAPMAFVLSAAAEEMVLVENGATPAPIVVVEAAPPETERAVNELADYIEKISGNRPDILTGAPVPAPPNAIWVGLQPELSRLFPNVDFEFTKPEETLIVCDGSNIAIAGRDRMAGDTQTEHGTANAVYTFIQDYLGVRWLWPGPLGEDVPKGETISVAPFVHRFAPTFLSRDVFIGAQRWGNAREWTRLQRLALQSRKGPAGSHAFTDWWERFSESHPEYFALQPDGTRSGWPDARTVKICESNPAVWRQWLADAAESLRRDPALNYLRAAPNDGHSSGICICDGCRAWDRQDGPSWRYTWEGTAQEYVAMSDRYVTFWNHCADLLRERFPERDDLYVRVNAYGPSTEPPLGPGLADNTVMGYVGHFPFTTEAARRAQKAQWRAWAEKAPNMLYRPNLWYWGGGSWGLPEVAMNRTVEDFRFLAENRCIGLTIDTAWEHWATQGPQYYLMAQLAWDPFKDTQAVLADYYQRGFGPAAGAIEQYWKLMEEATASVLGAPDLQLGGRGKFALVGIVRRVYTEDFLGRATSALDRADELAADGDPVYRQRIAFVRAGLDVTRLLIETIPVMDRVRASGGHDAEAVRQASANWERIEAIAREAGPIAFRLSTLHGRMRGGYMGGVQDYLGPPSEEFLEAAKDPRPPKPVPETAPGPEPQRPTTQGAATDFKLTPAEEAGWEIVFQDDFERDELGPDWKVFSGNWEIEDGDLVGTGALVSAKGYPGFQRLEFEAVSDVQPIALFEGGRETNVVVSDMSSFIHAKLEEGALPMRTGYFFQFGGFMNTQNQLRRANHVLAAEEDPETRIVPDKVHRIVVENDEGKLRFVVDGKLVLEASEGPSLVGPGQDVIGFYFYTRTRVRGMKLYLKPLMDDMI